MKTKEEIIKSACFNRWSCEFCERLRIERNQYCSNHLPQCVDKDKSYDEKVKKILEKYKEE